MSRTPTARQLAFLAAGVAAGVALALVVTALTDELYRATALLQVSAAVDPRATDPEAKVVAAEVLAETYADMLSERSFVAGIAPQVAAGRLGADTLDERVDANHPDGSALVKLTADAPTPAAATALATDVAGAFVALVQQLARQRTTQVEDELRRRIEELRGDPRAAGEVAALNAELARTAAAGVGQATSVTVAAPPAASDDPEQPNPLQNLAGGVLLGLVLGLGAGLLRAPAARPELEPEPAAVEPPQRPVQLLDPPANAVLAGAIPLRASPAGAAFEYSADGAAWQPVEGDVWDTTEVADGRYLVRATALDGEVGDPSPVGVDNTPPAVKLVSPEHGATLVGAIRLQAEAADEGSGVASVTFHLSTGEASWREIPAEWDTTDVPDGAYWLSAVATDRAGNQAATAPRPVRVVR
ncbi:MAG: Ig-like domain-containing protein [Gaiellaceae bacterium]